MGHAILRCFFKLAAIPLPLKEALQNRHYPRRKLLSSNDFQRCDNTYAGSGVVAIMGPSELVPTAESRSPG